MKILLAILFSVLFSVVIFQNPSTGEMHQYIVIPQPDGGAYIQQII